MNDSNEKEPNEPKNGCLIIITVLAFVAGAFIFLQDVIF